MNGIKFVLAAVFLACTTLAPVQAAAPNGRQAARAKALVIGLTADEAIGHGAAANVTSIERYLRGLPGFDPAADLKELKGKAVTAANILKAVDEIQVDSSDALFCYYAGHGAYDGLRAIYDPEGGHHFQLPGGDLMRATLLARLMAKGARLTVLITDACNVEAQFQPSAFGCGFAAASQPEPIQSTVFANLLFHYAGLVDLNGSSRNQAGFYDGDGWFTLGLTLELEQMDKSVADLNFDFNGLHCGPPEIGWEQFLKGVSESVHTVFAELKKEHLAKPGRSNPEAIKRLSDQADQRPQIFQLGVRNINRPAKNPGDFVSPSPSEWEQFFRPTPGAGAPFADLPKPHIR